MHINNNKLSLSLLIFFMVFLVMKISVAQEKGGKMNVAIFVYDGVEILDFAGPGEVFASAANDTGYAFNVYTVAVDTVPILSQRFLTVVPQYTIYNCPKPDIIVLPGGSTGKSAGDQNVLNWVTQNVSNAEIIMSVCTGAIILSRAGLLDGKHATTWHGRIKHLREITPKATIHENTRFVDDGQIITTAGVSAGIDGALHVIAKLLGEKEAARVARYMEYDKWEPNQGLVVKD